MGLVRRQPGNRGRIVRAGGKPRVSLEWDCPHCSDFGYQTAETRTLTVSGIQLCECVSSAAGIGAYMHYSWGDTNPNGVWTLSPPSMSTSISANGGSWSKTKIYKPNSLTPNDPDAWLWTARQSVGNTFWEGYCQLSFNDETAKRLQLEGPDSNEISIDRYFTVQYTWPTAPPVGTNVTLRMSCLWTAYIGAITVTYYEDEYCTTPFGNSKTLHLYWLHSIIGWEETVQYKSLAILVVDTSEPWVNYDGLNADGYNAKYFGFNADTAEFANIECNCRKELPYVNEFTECITEQYLGPSPYCYGGTGIITCEGY